MLFQILDFGFSISISLGSVIVNEAVFSQIFPNQMKTTANEQEFLRQDFTSYFFETCSGVLNDIEVDDLKSIMTTEFAQGLPSDTEFGAL